MSPRRAGALGVGFIFAGVVLVLLLMVLAARSGPEGVVHGRAHDSIFHGASPTAQHPTKSQGQPRPFEPGQSSIPGAVVIGALVRYALFAGLLYLLYRGIRWVIEELQARGRPKETVLEVEFDVVPDPEELAEEMRRDSQFQYEQLLGGDARNAIVACWDRFEDQAERVGIGRHPWETPSEFTIRLLDAVSADSAAVTELSHRYAEARFSTHAITEEHRTQALDALQRIHRSIGVPEGVTR